MRYLRGSDETKIKLQSQECASFSVRERQRENVGAMDAERWQYILLGESANWSCSNVVENMINPYRPEMNPYNTESFGSYLT